MPQRRDRALAGLAPRARHAEGDGTTVLGDFVNARFEHLGVATTFSRSGDKFMVNTEGPDGALRDYEIAYTFGVYPLQQYLIAFPGGRLQALGIAGTAGQRSREASTGFPSIPTRSSSRRPAALDRPRSDLELPVR